MEVRVAMPSDHETGDIGKYRPMVSRRRLLSASACTAAGRAIATGDNAEEAPSASFGSPGGDDQKR